MSVDLIKACKTLSMTPTQKSVLMALAWYASDDGEFWGSVATIVEHTCLSERAVRKTLHDLAAMGYLTATIRHGTSTKYTLTPAPDAPLEISTTPARRAPRPCTPCTPAPGAPLHQMQPPPAPDAPPPLHVVHPTPAPGAPNKQLTTTTKTREQQEARERESLSSADLVSLGIPEQVARDFLKIRKAKRAPLTQTSLDGIRREASQAGYTLVAAITLATESGWQGFKAEWVNKQGPQKSGGTLADYNRQVAQEALADLGFFGDSHA